MWLKGSESLLRIIHYCSLEFPCVATLLSFDQRLSMVGSLCRVVCLHVLQPYGYLIAVPIIILFIDYLPPPVVGHLLVVHPLILAAVVRDLLSNITR